MEISSQLSIHPYLSFVCILHSYTVFLVTPLRKQTQTDERADLAYSITYALLAIAIFKNTV